MTLQAKHSQKPAEAIPNRIHFVWFGSALPCFAAVAVRSAARHNPKAEISLWHEPQLDRGSRVRSLQEEGVRLQSLDASELFNRAQQGSEDSELQRALTQVRQIYSTLRSPAARSNIVRLLVLFLEGGIYLDTDTITLKPLDRLREVSAFCGLEHILWSKQRLNKKRPYYWTLGPLLSLLRLGCARVKPGYLVHRALLGWYDSAANNAVLGFSAGHPFLRATFLRMASLPEHEWSKRYRLGTHLLQEQLAAHSAARDAVTQYAPDYFYAIGPVVSAHYFHERKQASRALRELVPEDAHVLHWYASVSDLKAMDEQFILAQRERTMFAQLCADFVR